MYFTITSRAATLAAALAAAPQRHVHHRANATHGHHQGRCSGGVAAAPASLVAYKLPETGSTWFAELLNDFSEAVAVQHQWIKEMWERPASATAARRGECAGGFVEATPTNMRVPATPGALAAALPAAFRGALPDVRFEPVALSRHAATHTDARNWKTRLVQHLDVVPD